MILLLLSKYKQLENNNQLHYQKRAELVMLIFEYELTTTTAYIILVHKNSFMCEHDC